VDVRTFPSSALKLAWARHHLDALQKATEAFEQSEAAHVIGQFKKKRPGFDLIFEVQTPTIPEIPLRAGDAVGCMRDALDHLITELALAYRGANADLRSAAFPVCERRSQWRMGVHPKINKRSGEWKVRDIDPRARGIVYGLQPFYRKQRNGPFRAPNPLWVLNELRNIDKHRRLSVTALGITHGTVNLTHPPNIGEIRRWAPRRPPKDGTPILKLWLAPGTQEAEVSVDPNLAYKMGFEEPTAFKVLTQVVPTLLGLYEWTAAVLQRFHEFQSDAAKQAIERAVSDG
jgi:hypothetical protein